MFSEMKQRTGVEFPVLGYTVYYDNSLV